MMKFLQQIPMVHRLYFLSFLSGFILMAYLLITQQSHQQVIKPDIQLDTLKGWLYDSWNNSLSYIQPDDNTTVLLPTTIGNGNANLLVMVISDPRHSSLRMTIRETWGVERGDPDYPVDIYYLVGRTFNETLQKEIENEHHEYDDIIQEDFVDTYHNLSLKSVMMLKVLVTYCTKSVQYVMKTDDDVYLYIPEAVNFLRNKVRNSLGLLVGHVKHQADILGPVVSNWYSPAIKNKNNNKTYPAYLAGASYLMSVDVAIKLYRQALRIPLYHLEDVYITGILADEAHVKRRDYNGLTSNKRSNDPCTYKSAINSHHYGESDIRELHDKILRTNILACKPKPRHHHRKMVKVYRVVRKTTASPIKLSSSTK